MRTTLLIWILAALTAASGAVMVAAPDIWYATTPGVDHTGPFNPHFVRDIAMTFVELNGMPGAIISAGGMIAGTVQVNVTEDGVVSHVFVIVNPDKLTHLDG